MCRHQQPKQAAHLLELSTFSTKSSKRVAALTAAEVVEARTTTSASLEPGGAVLFFLGTLTVAPVSCSTLSLVLPF